MGNVLSYSGLTTKVRAMQSKLITEKQMEELVHLSSVPQVAAFLKKTAEYGDELENADETSLHRGMLEIILKKSVFQNFSKLYRFAKPEQRSFLDLYGKRYEIRVLKELIINIFDHRKTEFPDLTSYEIFFYEHSRLDLKQLAACTTMEELIDHLKGNEFHTPLSIVHHQGASTPFDYNMAMDLYYFSQIWKVRKKLFSGEDLKQLTLTFGEQFDMLNLQFIRRAKRFSDLSEAQIYAMLIPVHLKLRQQEIQAMVSAVTSDEVDAVFQNTYYGKKYQELNMISLEDFYQYLLRNTLTKQAHRNPYSVASLFSYLYHKEREVSQLIIAIECVRYGTSPEEAMHYIHSS